MQALLNAQKSGLLKSAEISLTVSSSADAYALKRAAEAGVKTYVLQEEDYLNNGFFNKTGYSANLLSILAKNQIQIVVLAGFLVILGEPLLSAYKNKIINVHPSLIPSFCGDGFYGLYVHEAALKKGVKITGATVHFVNDVTDGGEILMQKAVDVKQGDTPETLQRRVMEEAEWVILPQALEALCASLILQKKDL